MKHSLAVNKGLSLSQAQSISNMCYQRALEIQSKLETINNYSKTINYGGYKYTLQNGNKIPDNIIELLMEKAELHACQAFLMENIKAKDILLINAQSESPDLSQITPPQKPTKNDISSKLLKNVDMKWGVEQLSVKEYNEFIEAEAYASHIGQFIHKNGILTKLRNELPTIPTIEWIDVKDGEKTPVNINVHHTSVDLINLHEKLATLHRKYEQRVNYYKAKVNNLITQENARIAKHNADIQRDIDKEYEQLLNEYTIKYNEYLNKIDEIKMDFEIKRQEKIKEIASMRIQVDPRFQKTINKFLEMLSDDNE